MICDIFELERLTEAICAQSMLSITLLECFGLRLGAKGSISQFSVVEIHS